MRTKQSIAGFFSSRLKVLVGGRVIDESGFCFVGSSEDNLPLKLLLCFGLFKYKKAGPCRGRGGVGI